MPPLKLFSKRSRRKTMEDSMSASTTHMQALVPQPNKLERSFGIPTLLKLGTPSAELDYETITSVPTMLQGQWLNERMVSKLTFHLGPLVPIQHCIQHWQSSDG